VDRAAGILRKRNDGRDEPIVDPSLPVIDAHHHLFDRPRMRYMFEDSLADATAGHNIIASVYVETNTMARPDGPEVLRPLGEVEFAYGISAMSASGRYGSCRVAAASSDTPILHAVTTSQSCSIAPSRVPPIVIAVYV
jgi:hypothetical protein